MSSPSAVPVPTVRVLPAAPPELTVVLHAAAPAVVPQACPVPLPRSAPDAEHRMSFEQARAALARLGHED